MKTHLELIIRVLYIKISLWLYNIFFDMQFLFIHQYYFIASRIPPCGLNYIRCLSGQILYQIHFDNVDGGATENRSGAAAWQAETPYARGGGPPRFWTGLFVAFTSGQPRFRKQLSPSVFDFEGGPRKSAQEMRDICLGTQGRAHRKRNTHFYWFPWPSNHPFL